MDRCCCHFPGPVTQPACWSALIFCRHEDKVTMWLIAYSTFLPDHSNRESGLLLFQVSPVLIFSWD